MPGGCFVSKNTPENSSEKKEDQNINRKCQVAGILYFFCVCLQLVILYKAHRLMEFDSNFSYTCNDIVSQTSSMDAFLSIFFPVVYSFRNISTDFDDKYA